MIKSNYRGFFFCNEKPYEDIPLQDNVPVLSDVWQPYILVGTSHIFKHFFPVSVAHAYLFIKTFMFKICANDCFCFLQKQSCVSDRRTAEQNPQQSKVKQKMVPPLLRSCIQV